MQAEAAEALLEPALEVELLVTASFALDELAIADALLENRGRIRHGSPLIPVGRVFARGVQTADASFDFAVVCLQHRHGALHSAEHRQAPYHLGHDNDPDVVPAQAPSRVPEPRHLSGRSGNRGTPEIVVLLA